MGLLDTALGMFGGTADQSDDPKAKLIQAALSMLTNSQSGGSGAAGGLTGLIDAFQTSGMGDIVNSWVGTGHNLPISAEQIQSALGDGQLAHLAAAAGLSQDGAAGHLADILPGLVDKLTPHGEVSESGFGDLGGILQQVSSVFLAKS